MTRDSNRPRRIGELIRRELVELIGRELGDPRVSRLTITSVDVAPDLSHAKVFFTQLKGATTGAGTSKVLNQAAGFLRRALSRRLRLRTVPELRFQYDVSVEKGAAVSALIDRAIADDRTHKP